VNTGPDGSGNVLVIYRSETFPLRSSVRDHLHAFRRYSARRTFYWNIALGGVPEYLLKVPFDLVVFHTTFLSSRWGKGVFEDLVDRARALRQVAGIRVMMPQDEFFRTDVLGDFIKEFEIDLVLSVAPETEWSTIYPSVDRARVRFQQVLTGYLDEATLADIERLVRQSRPRPIDIGYRAWHALAWLGRHGQLKTSIAARFEAAAESAGLTTDISTRAEDTFYGDGWLRFLASCKYTIGVEGGATILDADGSLRERTEQFLRDHPEAGFDETEASCFPGRDDELQLKVLSPRHLEACATRTCQVLVEGSYNGVLQAGVHYLALRADLSNLDEVVADMKQDDRREAIVAAAYRDVVESGEWSYSRLVSDTERTALGAAAGTPIARSVRGTVLLLLTRALDWRNTAMWRVRHALVVPLRSRASRMLK